jgi:hypothetical protein
VRRPGGYGIIVDPDSRALEEWDTFTCAHCQVVVRVEPMCAASDMGGQCTLCDAPICKHCVGKVCTPWEKRCEEIEASYHARRSYGLL